MGAGRGGQGSAVGVPPTFRSFFLSFFKTRGENTHIQVVSTKSKLCQMVCGGPKNEGGIIIVSRGVDTKAYCLPITMKGHREVKINCQNVKFLDQSGTENWRRRPFFGAKYIQRSLKLIALHRTNRPFNLGKWGESRHMPENIVNAFRAFL